MEDTDSTGACPVVQKNRTKKPKRVPNHAVWEALTVMQSSIQTQEVKINQRTNPLTSRSTLLSNTEMFIGVKRRRAWAGGRATCIAWRGKQHTATHTNKRARAGREAGVRANSKDQNKDERTHCLKQNNTMHALNRLTQAPKARTNVRDSNREKTKLRKAARTDAGSGNPPECV